MKKIKKNKGPDVIRVSLWLCLMVAMVVDAGLVYYFGGANPSIYEKIIIYALLGGAAVAVIRLAVWGFGWVKNERVSELGLHIVRFAVILTAVVLCVFAMMSADYSSQYRQSESNELRQQALAARIQLQDMLGEELGTETAYYQTLYEQLPSLLDSNGSNSGRHINLYLFVSPDKQPVGTYFAPMEENEGIFAVGTGSRFGVTASASYIDRVYRNGELAFSEYIYGESGFENNFVSAFVPVYTTAGRPVGVLELCKPGTAMSTLFNFVAIELLLRIAALIAMFAFGFYGMMQLLDIVLRPRSVDRSCRVLSCGREAARPVLFFVSLCAGLPVMLLMGAEEMRGLITFENMPQWLSGITTLLPLCLYLICFLVGWVLVRKTGKRLTEAPSNISLIISTASVIVLMLMKDTDLFAQVPFMNQWYIPLALIALCGLCYGISYRTISKYQAQSDMLFGVDKYAYLCTALGVITGMILGGWLLDASGEAGVKVAMLLLNIAACAISIILLEDLDQTVEISGLSESKISSLAGLMLAIIPFGLACGYVWVYITNYLADNDYSVTARSIIMAAPVIAFCFGNRLRLKTRESQRGALCTGSVLASLSYLTMVWTPDPIMAIASCGLLCLAVIFMSAGVYSALLPGERGGAFAGLAVAAAVGALGFSLLSGFYAGRLCLLIVSVASVVLSFVFLGTKFPNRILAPEYREAIAGESADVTPEPEPLALAWKKEEKEPEEKYEAPHFVPFFRTEKSKSEPEPKPEPEAESEPISEYGSFFSSQSAAEPEPLVVPEEKSYDWDKVDVQVTDVMSEFFNDPEPEVQPQPETPVEEQPEMPIIFPDDDRDIGYTPGGGALPQVNEKLGSDEGYIDFNN